MLPLPSPRPSRPHYRPASISLITEGHGSPDLPVTSADPPNGRSRVTLRATERPLSWDSATSPLPRRTDPPPRDRVNASHRGSPPRALPIAITGRPATPWRTGSHPPLQRATPQAVPHRDHPGDRPPTGDWAYVSHRDRRPTGAPWKTGSTRPGTAPLPHRGHPRTGRPPEDPNRAAGAVRVAPAPPCRRSPRSCRGNPPRSATPPPATAERGWASPVTSSPGSAVPVPPEARFSPEIAAAVRYGGAK